MDAKSPHPLPLSAAQKQIRDDVPLVCTWALVNAFAIACGQVYLSRIQIFPAIDPGYIFYTMFIFFFVVLDLTCLADLLRGDGWGKQYAAY
uniref:Uncharacterized protein n=1 Tax=Aegilops tauschii TaxID=37682 RepID=M8BCR0_AEGTA